MLEKIENIMHKIALPKNFLAMAKIIIPLFSFICLILLALGISLILTVPPDYQQGAFVKIMFVHVPSVWLAMFIYLVMVVAALAVIIWRHPLAAIACRSAAPIGAVFTFIGLATGSIWGKPIWGTWWEWDARLTSFLILFFIYLALIAFWRATNQSHYAARATRSGAIAVLVGAVNLPIIKFSVDWFLTLHQPASILRTGGIAMPQIYWQPLFLMAGAFLALFIVLYFVNIKAHICQQKIASLTRKAIR